MIKRNPEFGVFALVCMLLSPSFVSADTIKSAAAAGWQSWSTTDLDQNGKPYWDMGSWDGNKKNIGYYLTNTGAFYGSSAGPGAIDYWGKSDGKADLDFSLLQNSDSCLAAIQIEIAGYAPKNKFGWYDVETGVRTEIFTGSDNSSTTAKVFIPSVNYGFYLYTPDNKYFYTESSKNINKYQQFAIFRENPNTFWIGMEDLSFCGSTDGDFNDMVVKVTTVVNTVVPEPSTMLLLGPGLLGVALLRRRKIRS